MLVNLLPCVVFIGSKNKGNPETEVKRGPGRPRRYPAPASQEEEEGEEEEEEEASEIKPIEVNILSIQSEEMAEAEETNAEPPKKEKVNLGQVLELAVQSMSVTMETEEEDLTEKQINKPVSAEASPEVIEITQQKMTFETTKDHDSDFEWKLENEEEPVIHSPPAKKKKMTASSSFIVPTVSIFSPHNFVQGFHYNPMIFCIPTVMKEVRFYLDAFYCTLHEYRMQMI